jgi:hypothetical protein
MATFRDEAMQGFFTQHVYGNLIHGHTSMLVADAFNGPN